MSSANDDVQFLPLNKVTSDASENHVSEERTQKKSYGKKIHLSVKPLCIALGVCIILIVILLIVLFATKTCSSTSENKSILQQINVETKNELYRYEDGSLCDHQNLRLPTDILPYQYNISMYPIPISLNKNEPRFKPSYSANITIETTCNKSTNYIVLHRGADFIVLNLTVSGAQSGLTVVSSKFCEFLSHDYIRLSKNCIVGEVITIYVSFKSSPLGKLDGFYMGRYKDKHRKEKRVLSTHMEPISARKAFPCFDEPDMKAKFVLEMVRDADHVSLFNMPLKETISDNMCSNCYRDKFMNSVLMSTYLVAFALLPKDYVYLKKNITGKVSQVEVGMWAPSFANNSLDFSMNVTKKVLPFFEDLFNLSYPLPKLDMIAVPEFSAGAMENWGLIIYRFVTLLYDKKTTQTATKQQIAEVVSHEIAHQWFGNIVTMKWWDDLWLNEGFATFTQSIGVNEYAPSWNMMDRCYVQFVYHALQTDSMLHSHPIIIVGVIDPAEIESLFDDISYFKGSTLILMLEDVIGRQALKEGLRIYLNRYAYKNAASKDLFAAFSEGFYKVNNNKNIPKESPVSNLPEVMDTWVYQQNYPLVTVKIRGKILIFTQERFLLYPNGSNIWIWYKSKYDYKWIIPVKYVTDQETEPRLIWINMVSEHRVELDYEPKYIKINIRQKGLYRSNYEESNWKQLIQLCRQDKVLGPADKAGLINDAFSLTYLGRINVSIALALVETLENDISQSSTPWTVAVKKITEAYVLLMSEEETLTALSQFMLRIMKKPLAELTKKPLWLLSHTERMKYVALMQVAVSFNEPTIVSRLQGEYNKYRADTNYVLDPDEKDFVFQVGVSNGNRSDWEFFWNRLQNELLQPSESKSVMSALAITQDITLINRLIENSLDIRKIRMQDSVSLIVRLGKQTTALDLVWTFLMRNWDTYLKRFKDNTFLLSELTKIPADFRTEFDYEKASQFFEKVKLSSGQRNALQSLESIRANTEWVKYNIQDFAKYLNVSMRQMTMDGT